jgi:hypothetical protein
MDSVINNVSQIIELLIKTVILLIPIVVPIIILWVREHWLLLQSALPEKIRWALDDALRRGVYAVEQMVKAGLIKPEERKAKAVEIIYEYLVAQGYHVDKKLIGDLVEAFLHEMRLDEKSA